MVLRFLAEAFVGGGTLFVLGASAATITFGLGVTAVAAGIAGISIDSGSLIQDLGRRARAGRTEVVIPAGAEFGRTVVKTISGTTGRQSPKS